MAARRRESSDARARSTGPGTLAGLEVRTTSASVGPTTSDRTSQTVSLPRGRGAVLVAGAGRGEHHPGRAGGKGTPSGAPVCRRSPGSGWLRPVRPRAARGPRRELGRGTGGIGSLAPGGGRGRPPGRAAGGALLFRGRGPAGGRRPGLVFQPAEYPAGGAARRRGGRPGFGQIGRAH